MEKTSRREAAVLRVAVVVAETTILVAITAGAGETATAPLPAVRAARHGAGWLMRMETEAIHPAVAGKIASGQTNIRTPIVKRAIAPRAAVAVRGLATDWLRMRYGCGPPMI